MFNKLLKKKIIECGDYSMNPVEGSNCELEISNVRFKDASGERPIDKSTAYFSGQFGGNCTIGFATHYVDIDFERCLTQMFLEEVSLLEMIYLDKEGEKALEISCIVKISTIDEDRLACDLTLDKKLSWANDFKNAGVKLIQSHRTVDAFRQFSKSIRLLLTFDVLDRDSMPECKKKEVSDLKLKLYNNMAFCQLSFDQYRAAIALCNKVLEMDGDNVKALYRRGTAFMGLQDWDAAYDDINRVLVLDSTVSEAKAKMIILKDKVSKSNESYKKAIKNMFV